MCWSITQGRAEYHVILCERWELGVRYLDDEVLFGLIDRACHNTIMMSLSLCHHPHISMSVNKYKYCVCEAYFLHCYLFSLPTKLN